MNVNTKLNNTSMIVKSNLCTGCGSCYAICPNDAIDFQYQNEQGIYCPTILVSKCKNCGKCLDVCPGLGIDFEKQEKVLFGARRSDGLLGYYDNCYTGHSRDDRLRYISSSGGLVTELLRTALSIGYIDCAVITRVQIDAETGKLEIGPCITESEDEVMSGIGSKYAPSPVNISVKEILSKDKRYAIVALPCHIHGIRLLQEKYPQLKQRIPLCLGLFCAKTIKLGGTYYLMNKLNIDLSSVESLNYRGMGWPGGLTIKYKDNRNIFIETKDYYKSDFGAFMVPRCTVCCDHSNELADLSFGDAWHQKDMDDQGSTTMIVRTKSGAKLVKKAVDNHKIVLKSTPAAIVVQGQDGFAMKKQHIGAIFKMWKIFGKRLPQYKGVAYVKPNVKSYLIAWSVMLKTMLASNRICWPVLQLFCRLTDRLGGGA